MLHKFWNIQILKTINMQFSFSNIIANYQFYQNMFLVISTSYA
jgi:hypothetical protein